MSMTGAERQARYRKRRMVNEHDARIDLLIPVAALVALKRLVRRHRLTDPSASEATALAAVLIETNRRVGEELPQRERSAYRAPIVVGGVRYYW